MKRLAIIGSGDLGQLIAHHAINDNHYDVIGFFDDFSKKGSMVNTIPILGGINDIAQMYAQNIFDEVMIGIGYKHMQFRKQIFNSLTDLLIPIGQIIHTSSYIDKSAKLGKGTFILPGCTIDKDVILGDNVLLNTATVIAHDSIIDSHSFLAPGVCVAGKVHIKEQCIIGINSTIIDNIIIDSNIQIGGGSVIIDHLKIKGLYVGVPGRLIKELK